MSEQTTLCSTGWHDLPAELDGPEILPGQSANMLLHRAITVARDPAVRCKLQPRYIGVMAAFAVNSLDAWKLCRWAHLRPDEMVLTK